MATTWIKPTYAHKRYNRGTTVKRKIDYITDESKAVMRSDVDYFDVESIMNYVNDLDKTENSALSGADYVRQNELISSYECFPEHAAEQFAISMDMYESITGRTQKDNSRLVYHMRQAFAPGEVDPRVANRIGYELALEFTGGNHAFVVATHTNTKSVHNHIIFNAFNLECNGKFKDPLYSGKRDVARISDKLCREYELSVIEIKQGWRDSYNIWEEKQGITKADKPPTHRKQLENIITQCLEKRPQDFEQLLEFMAEDYNCIAKRRGKDISVKMPFSKNRIRLSSLSFDFWEDVLRQQIEDMQKNPMQNIVSRIDEITKDNFSNDSELMKEMANAFVNAALYPENDEGDLLTEPHPQSATPKQTTPKSPAPQTTSAIPQNNKPKLQLIIDIQNSMKAAEGIGYKKWAEKFNLEQMSQTLLFIEKHELSFAQLENMATRKPKVLQNIKDEIGEVENRMSNISLLQQHIGTYGKTKEIYKQYKQIGNKEHREQFRQQNYKAITAHENAKTYFDEQGYGFGNRGRKLPRILELRQQYAILHTEKRKLWDKHHEINRSDKDIDNAYKNVCAILNIEDEARNIATRQKSANRNAPSL